MTLSNLPRPILGILAIAPALLVVTAMFIAIPWLKSLPDSIAMTIAIIASIFVMGWSLFIAFAAQKTQDEVQRHSERVGLQYGFTGGALFVAILLMIPPFHDVVINTANNLAISLKGDAAKAPMLAYVAGIATLAFAQSIGALIACRFWWRSKSS